MNAVVVRAAIRWRILATLTVATLALAACGAGPTSSPSAGVPAVPASGVRATSSGGPGAAMSVPGGTESATTSATTSATSGPEQTVSPTINVKCPSAAVVGQALDMLANQAPTGPTISTSQVGTESMTTCNYSGMFRTMISFAVFGSPVDMASAEANTKAMKGSTPVSGLGDAAYYVPDAGLDVFVDPVSMLQISCSKGPTAGQYEALARTVLGT